MLKFEVIKSKEGTLEYNVIEKINNLINYLKKEIEEIYGGYNSECFNILGTIHDPINALINVRESVHCYHNQEIMTDYWCCHFKEKNIRKFLNIFENEEMNETKEFIHNSLKELNNLIKIKVDCSEWSNLDPYFCYKPIFK